MIEARVLGWREGCPAPAERRPALRPRRGAAVLCERNVTAMETGSAAARPSRICFVSSQVYGLLRPSSGLPVGGAEVQIASLAKGLARDPRFEVMILTGDGARKEREPEGAVTIVLHPLCAVRPVRRGPGAMDKAVEQGQQWVQQCPASLASAVRAIVRGGYACRRGLLSVPPVRRLLQTVRHAQIVARWVGLFRSIGADLYVTRCAAAQVGYMQIACRLLGRPFVYMAAHEIDVSGEYARAHPKEGALYERGLRRADAVVCQHAGQADMVRSRYRRDAQVIRSISPQAVRSGGAAARRTILWMARVDAWKQPDLFVRLAGRLPDESFVMVAPPSQADPDNLTRLQEWAGRLPNLRLFEQIPFEDTAALFEDAKVFVNTSRWEGFPNTFLQAAACGTPIVSWAVNPEGLLERHRFGLCANGDEAKLEALVRSLCADEARRNEMGERGRQYVRDHHDPVAVVGQLADLCRRLCDEYEGRRGPRLVPPLGAGRSSLAQ